MQTILGANGSIGIPLAKELKKYTENIRLVSRNPKKVNESDELFKCDLTSSDDVFKAVEGSEVVYMTAGFPYKTEVWKQIWIPVIKNIIDACKQHKSKLVFFDNIYMYDPEKVGNMKEDCPVNPSSEKGKIRKTVAELVLKAHESGEIKTLIARSADFYGPDSEGRSVLQEVVIKNLKAGKRANWLGSADNIHSFTFTLDAAKGTAILGNDDSAYGQIWHLPTSSEKITGKQLIEMVASELNTKPKYVTAGNFMVKTIGLFDPIMKEFVEMMYQYDRDYFFDSSKFNEKYNFVPTSYKEGIKNTINA
ncbi:MAG: NAD-dependent epimerase/dehydratase family protein [Melioribacteraceae bacterium]|nr:NAD-dependent epimerase/dehydratase family protein [Melioribacteraceae bacterium]